MGEDRRADEPPRKVPRLDLPVAAAAGADSGCGEAVSAPEEEGVEVTSGNKQEERAEVTSGNKRCCSHVPTDSALMKTLRPSLFSKRAGRCELCWHPFEGSGILVCLVCGRYFCSGVGSVEYPFGHSRLHAREEQHWVAALPEAPESAFCFKCDSVMDGPRDAIIRGLVAAAEADSGRTDKALLEAEGYDGPCNHFPIDDAHKDMLRSSMMSEHAGKCDLCKTVKGRILVCMECGLHFCGGPWSLEEPSGHSRLHAKERNHWVAASYDDPEFGYCFKCQHEVCVDVSPDDTEMMDKVGAEFSNEARYALGSAGVHDYAIRGMPNLGNTCYLNALVQCLLVLDKLRARMLGTDAPDSLLASTLMELFVETSSAGGMLNPEKLLFCVRFYDQAFKGTDMQDSQELFLSLCKQLNKAEEKTAKNGAATVVNSIFGFEMSETNTCTCSLTHLIPPSHHCGISMSLPSKVHPAKSAASSQSRPSLNSQLTIDLQLCPPNEQDSTEGQRVCQRKGALQGPLQAQEDKVSCPNISEGIFDVPVKSVDLLPQNLFNVKVVEGMNATTADSIASIEECLLLFCENVTEWRCDNCKTNEELNTGRSRNNEQTVASTNEDTTVGGDSTEQSDGTKCQNEQCSGLNNSSVECVSSSSRQLQGSVAQDQILLTVDKFAEETNLGVSCGEKDSAACNTPKEPECHAGNLEAVSSCLAAEKQTDLLRAQQNQDTSIEIKIYQDRRTQIGLDHRACQLKNDRNEQQRDRNGDAIQTSRFNNLPPVLTLHLKRFNSVLEKISGHVRYEEYLDVGPFIDPSSVDKDNSLYRLVGVVEHRGTKSLKIGHYVAYVRARKLGNPQQQDRCSDSWFCADDRTISKVSLEDVLKREAYILFYERME